ncbi:MAG: V-type ATP synthase subunit A [Erysipelotrichaceae bacterium]|nr:V-type ATP synthase subunit A [Erysipelotrichaceae bacterium]
MNQNLVYSINGPVVKVKQPRNLMMMEMVYVGHAHLLGEVINVSEEYATIQVYESTTGLKPKEPVEGTGSLLCATLGPGIITNIFDGIERPLKVMAEDGVFISDGKSIDSLSNTRKWNVTMKVKEGDHVLGGMIFATCLETAVVEHRSMIPPQVNGEVIYAAESGEYTISDVLVKVKDARTGKIVECTLVQKWPIRHPRPVLERKPLNIPLETGQRVVDTFFPLAKGGAAALPGGFGAGKTMLQHQLAKWCDADIIVYVGCGERGNEMTQVLEEFSELIDPRNGQPLTERTCLIANTSNMPVAAREASIYTGITIAEYYRDMGYHVAIMADSTSRWAEALREISGRLEEMPAEEGFPAYLSSRISQFYERASYVETLNGLTGSVTIIGAVSPQGGDFSEPVTQNTKRLTRCFWALDKSLAYTRHFPAVNWNMSYSEYLDGLSKWYQNNVDKNFVNYRQEMLSILHEETELMEIVKLIGSDILADDQKLILEMARVIRVGFLQQDAFHPDDTYVTYAKQVKMLELISYLYKKAKVLIDQHIPVSAIAKTGIFELLIKIKYDVPNNQLSMLDDYFKHIDDAMASID